MKPQSRDTKKRAYYAAPDEIDNNDSYIEWQDEDSDLEHNYQLGQNAHFAAIWRSSSSFFAAASCPASPKTPRPTTPKPSECRSCHMAFPSRSRMHAHLIATGHNRSAPNDCVVIESKRIAPPNPEVRLASYHFAKARFVLDPKSASAHRACLDSGYGNSAVDEEFIAKFIPDPHYHTLESHKEVRGIGGGIAMCTKLLMLPLYWTTIDERFAKMVRPFHVFPDLGVDLLCGIDTLREEGIDMYYSSSVPQMRIASCNGAAVTIEVCDGEKLRKVPVRSSETTVIPANSTAIVQVKMPRSLPSNQDYLFTPSRLKSVSTSGAGAPHAVMWYDQNNVLFTNLQDTDMTFRNTVIGHLHSTPSEDIAVWHEAAKDVRGFLGLATIAKACTAALAFTAAASKQTQTLDPEADSPMPLPDDAPSFPLEPPRPRPCPVKSAAGFPSTECAVEQWSPPPWLQEQYVPQYEYDLPEGIRVPDVSLTTYAQVVINETDNISPDQVNALWQLVARHPLCLTMGWDGMRSWTHPRLDATASGPLSPVCPDMLRKDQSPGTSENW
jgi:hypothetical protein